MIKRLADILAKEEFVPLVSPKMIREDGSGYFLAGNQELQTLFISSDYTEYETYAEALEAAIIAIEQKSNK